jgi:hypothetical protein
MKINASRMIDTLEEVIATAGMMSKEQLENVVAGSAGWVCDHSDHLSLEEMEKIDRLQDRILAKAA